MNLQRPLLGWVALACSSRSTFLLVVRHRSSSEVNATFECMPICRCCQQPTERLRNEQKIYYARFSIEQHAYHFSFQPSTQSTRCMEIIRPILLALRRIQQIQHKLPYQWTCRSCWTGAGSMLENRPSSRLQILRTRLLSMFQICLECDTQKSWDRGPAKLTWLSQVKR